MRKKIPKLGQKIIVTDDIWNKTRYGTVTALLGTQFTFIEDGMDWSHYVFYTDNNWREDESQKR